MKYFVILPSVTAIILAIAAIIGYLMNIVAVFGSDFSTFTFLLAMRLLGIVAIPLGAVMGWV